MTGRQRLYAALHRQPVGRLPWTTLVDEPTLSALPSHLGVQNGIDFYRHIGCDILMLNGWGTEHWFRSPIQKWPDYVRVESRQEGTRSITDYITQKGTLTSVFDRGHPVKYSVSTLEEAQLYRWIWEGVKHEEWDDSPALAALDQLIGDDGMVMRFWGKTAIPHLIEYAMGVQNFYFLYADHPKEVEGLINTIHTVQKPGFEILARTPCDCVAAVENTSTQYISPQIYERYNMPQQRDFVQAMQKGGKVAILHMCGHVRRLLPLIRETGCDGIHALTPPPNGDCPWEDALDVIGDDLIIMGCIPPTVFGRDEPQGIVRYLDEAITPRIRQSNFILHQLADGVAIDLERFVVLKNWIEKNGALQG